MLSDTPVFVLQNSPRGYHCLLRRLNLPSRLPGYDFPQTGSSRHTQTSPRCTGYLPLILSAACISMELSVEFFISLLCVVYAGVRSSETYHHGMLQRQVFPRHRQSLPPHPHFCLGIHGIRLFLPNKNNTRPCRMQCWEVVTESSLRSQVEAACKTRLGVTCWLPSDSAFSCFPRPSVTSHP